LSSEHACEMFLRLARRANDDQVEALGDVVQIAGFLPLAISLLARVYARHPAWTLAHLVTETRVSMVTLTAEKDSVAAALEVSYLHLTTELRRFFHLVALNPGITVDIFFRRCPSWCRLARSSCALGRAAQRRLANRS